MDAQTAIIKGYFTELANLQVEKQRVEVIKETNKENFLKTKQGNREKLAQYQREMNVINSGKFDLEQQQGETNEHFLDRLNAQANSEVINETLLNAQFEIMTKFKTKMKELIRTDWKIEQVANSVDNFGEIYNKLDILKRWELFKTNFLKMFGENNSLVSVDDILEFIYNFLNENYPINVKQSGINPTLMSVEEFEALYKDDMLKYLTLNGIKIKSKKTKADLVELYKKFLYGSSSPKPTVGTGIKPLGISDCVSFGNVHIYLKKLYYKNELVVKWKTKLSIQGFKNCKVSEQFVSIIMGMLEGKVI
jgi:hypothetical protein